ncbi:uncharacterized protein LOC135133159 [Zophobas morio]|uniref:uncharacterized protein LOC135133159 n=1 Tax=Zophobas morio TaxID=2755281 RepID=UPI0030837097
MSLLVFIYSILYSAVLFESVLCDAQSCFACAGPKVDCVANNRTDFLKMDCTTFKVEGQSLIQRTSQPDLLEKFDSEVGAIESGTEVGCITLTFEHDKQSPQERALKSCVPKQVFDEDVCTYMEELVAEIGGKKTSCSFCKSDDCNSTVSVSDGRTVILLLCIAYVFRFFL